MNNQPPTVQPVTPSATRSWGYWIGIILTVATVVWLVFTTDWRETWSSILAANGWLILTAVLLNLSTIPLRAFRWQIIFPQPRPSFKSVTTAMLIGQAINIVAPARFGDLVRASLIEEKSPAFTLGTMVIQTAQDLIMTASLIIFILFQLTLPAEWQSSGQVLIILSLVSIGGILSIVLLRKWLTHLLIMIRDRFTSHWLTRILSWGIDLLNSFDTIKQPKILIGTLLLSILIWTIYGMTNFVLLRALTTEATVLAAYLALVVLQLGISIPSSPGRIGVYHFLGQQSLEIAGQDSSIALTFAFILHLISIVMPAILGLVLAWQSNIRINQGRSLEY